MTKHNKVDQDHFEKLKYAGAYKTYALADNDTINEENNVSMPSEKAVDEAREFVNTNEK